MSFLLPHKNRCRYTSEFLHLNIKNIKRLPGQSALLLDTGVVVFSIHTMKLNCIRFFQRNSLFSERPGLKSLLHHGFNFQQVCDTSKFFRFLGFIVLLYDF